MLAVARGVAVRRRGERGVETRQSSRLAGRERERERGDRDRDAPQRKVSRRRGHVLGATGTDGVDRRERTVGDRGPVETRLAGSRRVGTVERDVSIRVRTRRRTMSQRRRVDVFIFHVRRVRVHDFWFAVERGRVEETESRVEATNARGGRRRGVKEPSRGKSGVMSWMCALTSS
jgi:hypothetical protein